jgi:hypothetical protein
MKLYELTEALGKSFYARYIKYLGSAEEANTRLTTLADECETADDLDCTVDAIISTVQNAEDRLTHTNYTVPTPHGGDGLITIWQSRHGHWASVPTGYRQTDLQKAFDKLNLD